MTSFCNELQAQLGKESRVTLEGKADVKWYIMVWELWRVNIEIH